MGKLRYFVFFLIFISLKNTKKHITRETLKGLLDNRYKFEEESRNEFKKVFGNETYNYTFSD